MQHPPPRVGDIVPYVSHGTPARENGRQAYACRTAIVTKAVELRGGTWHWAGH
ncbi:hypothetical protein LG634_24575 [Streptomyces bambusae]|uniref:hypothetical protein n=1 Tax=Streptomyces bambusae TaxID=1550616 RepID=UPI001CFEC0D3|nr:hypothetical protein [Streptomyces bambusae]MCB5167989.1 hypothetical protein [Streptomyces bambusae]